MNGRVDISRHLNTRMSQALLALSNETAANLQPSLFELVKIRASQINGCAYCIDMHTKDARAVPGLESELVALTFGVIVINSWNRLAVSFRAPVGTYQPRAVAV